MATIKKAQRGVTATPDSTSYYNRKADKAVNDMVESKTPVEWSVASNRITAAQKNAKRQKLKGKPGHDKNGFPIKKGKAGIMVKKAQAGGVTKANPKAPMVDPDGAFTTVQKRTIAGAKMAKKGMSIKKGMHKMPNGSMMKNSAMKSKSKTSKK
jgi:hypothetical protein